MEGEPGAGFRAGDSGSGAVRRLFLHSLPAPVICKFCSIMDGLSELDWTRFASEVLHDQTVLRLAMKKDRRTDFVMQHWENRNGQVGQLIDLLERLQLLRARDVILTHVSSLSPPPPPPLPLAPPVMTPAPPPPRLSYPSSQSQQATPTLSTCPLSTEDKGGGATGIRRLPGPAPPPSGMLSKLHPPLKCAASAKCDCCASGSGVGDSRVMCWSYEEVHTSTNGFSPSLRVGEGGFGVVYRATLRSTDCAVKRLKQDCLSDWAVLKESFHTEVDKLSKFRHPNIVDLLGVSEGGGSVCLIYSFMENGSLEDQLHCESGAPSWSLRLSIIRGVSSALSFIHSPPDGHAALIHGDVKSSNILLDRHLVPKLADFGLARFACRTGGGGDSSVSRRRVGQTTSVGRTADIRGTLAYLPDEYMRNRKLGTAVDVYSFGVVLLEVLTGRRALEGDSKSGDRYLKDLVDEVEDSATGSCEAAWRKQLDHRLLTVSPGGAAAEPVGWMNMVTLACRCLDKNRAKRPKMSEVLEKLKEIDSMMGVTCLPSLPGPRPLCSVNSNVDVLSSQLSELGPLKDMDPPLPSSSSSCSPAVPHPLHSSSSSSSLSGPCETDESRGFSQYDLFSRRRSNESGSRSGPLCTMDQNQWRPQFVGTSVPTEDLYNYAPPPPPPLLLSAQVGGATAGFCEVTERFSPAASLQSSSPQPSGGGRGSGDSRGPEESDELDYAPPQNT